MNIEMMSNHALSNGSRIFWNHCGYPNHQVSVYKRVFCDITIILLRNREILQK